MEKLRIKLVERFGSEDNVVSAWNKYVEDNMETETENIKFYLNNAENIANIISNMSKEGIAKSIAQSSYACYDSMDRYVYELSDRFYSTNSMFATIKTDALERFYNYLQKPKEDKLK
jgi:UDP-glucose 4-epimerase